MCVYVCICIVLERFIEVGKIWKDITIQMSIQRAREVAYEFFYSIIATLIIDHQIGNRVYVTRRGTKLKK